MNLFKFLLSILILSGSITANAGIRIDLDMNGRNTAEVTESGYSQWVINNSMTYTENGVTFTLKSLSSSGDLTTSWYKGGVSSPNYARLTCDGIYIKDGNSDVSYQMEISGLSTGEHTLLTYHNAFGDYSSSSLSNINIYVDNQLKVSSFQQSYRKLTPETAASSYLRFTATAGKAVVVKFVADKSRSVNDYNVFFNAFALDVPNLVDQATTPIPGHGDFHVDADQSKSYTLKWTAAKSAVAHNVYFGTNESTISSATTSSSSFKGKQTTTSYAVSSLSNLETYYWRIDEIAADGSVTKGDVWNFRPRHLAFPEAEGYGRFATGGRGGKVVYVTNLNDSGKGSFREAMTNDIGPRTIVFAVSGLITLKSRLTQVGQYVTIAGQTAPGRGVCFRSSPVGVGGESICRFIRVRLGSGPTADGLGMAGCNNSITDHCSVGWTIDEAFSSRNAKNITVQRILISEALNIAGHKNYPEGTGHGYAATVGGDVGSLHHNLLAHNAGRNWSLAGGVDGDGNYNSRMDVFNNVVYNWYSRVTDGGAHEVNYVGNYYKKGAASKVDYTLSADLEGYANGTQSYYYHNNILQEKNNGAYLCDGTNDECGRKYTVTNGQIFNWELWRSKPFFESYAKIESARNAYKSVLSDVGCTMPLLDSHDERMINETLNGTYSCTGAKTKLGGIIDADSESKESYDYYTSESRPSGFDSDWDGLPDWWEEMFGTNVNSASGDFSDSNADPDGDGYTNLEDYLYWMSVPRVETSANKSATLNLSDYFKGFTSSPSYSVASTPANVTVSVSGTKVTVTPKAAGIYYFKIKVKDSQDDVMTRTFGVKAEGVVAPPVPEMYIYNSETTDLWTATERWTPEGLPTEKDTVIIRTGEAKAANIDQSAPLFVEATGVFRLTADCTVNDLTLQGGTLKSHTSNPLFILTSNITVEENSTIWAGSVAASVFRIDGTISGSKNLEKTNVGVLNLNVDASGFSGVWTVSGGTLLASKSDALGTGGVNVNATDTLKIAAANETAFLNMEETSNLTVNADLTVAKATLGNTKLAAGTYTSADYPNFISGGGKLIVTEGETTGVDFIGSGDFRVTVVPNPVLDEATVVFMVNNSQNCELQLLDTKGELLFLRTLNLNEGENGISIPVQNLSSGIYFIKAMMIDNVLVFKMIKK